VYECSIGMVLKNYENATYEAIIEALESNSVGNRRLAKTFRELRDRGISTCMLNSFECWIDSST